jgi:hypothetical protein
MLGITHICVCVYIHIYTHVHISCSLNSYGYYQSYVLSSVLFVFSEFLLSLGMMLLTVTVVPCFVLILLNVIQCAGI